MTPDFAGAGTDHIHEIFYFARKLAAGYRQDEIDDIGLVAVAAALDDSDPLPLFLRSPRFGAGPL